MTLRVRLSLIVSMLFLAGMLLGLSFLISNARQRVVDEVDAAASLTYQLLNLMLQRDEGDHAPLIEQLQSIDDVRHLDIRIIASDRDTPVARANSTEGPATTVAGSAEAPPPQTETAAVPAWFAWLVQTRPLDYRIPLDESGTAAILIRANPADEIAEVWMETRGFLIVLLLVLLILNGFLYFTLGRWLAPVSAIVTGLVDAEHGNFSGHIPQASLPEMKLIAGKLNQLTAVLRDSKADNERLTRRSLLIQEDERKHMARELHDELGQSISAIKAIAYSISQRTAGLDQMSAEGAARICGISNHISGHVRSMMSRLRPPVLDELGLVSALQVMIDAWNRDHSDTFGSFCSFRSAGDWSGLDADLQISIYRIIQEALTNVARHASAERVDVVLTEAGSISIVDNGCGYDQDRVKSGMGLTGIRERCQAHGAEFRLVTGVGKGVSITIRFPQATALAAGAQQLPPLTVEAEGSRTGKA